MLDPELFRARDVLIYMLWRRANMLRSAILRADIRDELMRDGIIKPITDEEIAESKQRLKDIGIDIDKLRNGPGEDGA